MNNGGKIVTTETFIKLNPEKIPTTVEKKDVIILYVGDKHFWVCDKRYKPRKLKDGRIQYKLAKDI